MTPNPSSNGTRGASSSGLIAGKMAVMPEHQRRGIGSLLVLAGIESGNMKEEGEP